MTTCSKIYTDLPFAHRQHKHKGHCSKIHGHNWAFKFTFGAEELDANGFVIDFGDLKWLRAWLEERFDHTLVLNIDDPDLEELRESLTKRTKAFADLIIVPNCGAEGLARWIFEEVEVLLRARTDERVFIISVEVLEDSRNSATFTPPAKTCSGHV